MYIYKKEQETERPSRVFARTAVHGKPYRDVAVVC